jgi:hypothetical protein
MFLYLDKENCKRYEHDSLPNHEGETLFKAETCVCDSDL